MRRSAKDLLAAWLVLLLVTTGAGLAHHDGRLAGQPVWALCGDAGGAGIPGPTSPDGPHPCPDCLAPALAAVGAPPLARSVLPVPVAAGPGAHRDAPAYRLAPGPGIRAPPRLS